jgi:hypothetical protein
MSSLDFQGFPAIIGNSMRHGTQHGPGFKPQDELARCKLPSLSGNEYDV